MLLYIYFPMYFSNNEHFAFLCVFVSFGDNLGNTINFDKIDYSPYLGEPKGQKIILNP